MSDPGSRPPSHVPDSPTPTPAKTADNKAIRIDGGVAANPPRGGSTGTYDSGDDRHAPDRPVDVDAKPTLPRGVRLKHDTVRGEWLLLAPERMLKLNDVSVEILKRCTGEASVAAIVDDLATAFRAPRERIRNDVEAMLATLAGKRLIDLR